MEICGQIMLSNKAKFLFVCAFCDEEFKEMLSFGKHIHQDHVKVDVSEFEDLKETITNPPLNFIQLASEASLSTFSQNQVELDSVKEENDLKSVETLSELNYVPVEAVYLPTISEHQNSTDSENFIPMTPKKQKQDAGLKNEKNQLFHTQSRTTNNKDVNTKIIKNGIFKCEDCDREFTTRAILVQHTRIHTGRKNHICPHCSKRFIKKPELARHIRIHTGERPFKCTLCPKSFNDKSGLDMHIRRHLGDKRYACNICDSRFVQSTEVKLHMRTHTGEKPYQCDECGAKFSASGKLSVHKKRHANTRNHKCEICSKEFFNASALKFHLIVHSKERPFQCEICLATYPRQESLRTHMKIHSDVKEYVCKICGKAFAQNAGLYSHMKSHGAKLGQTMKAE